MASLGCKFYLLVSILNTRSEDDNSDTGQIYVTLDRRSINSDTLYEKDIENAA